MERPELLSPLGLAFLGDTVYDLLVREALLRIANRPPRALQRAAATQVNARAQAQVARHLLALLTPQEAELFRRGKNAQPGHVPRNCSKEEYSMSTALECLFGWLWLSGQEARARALFGATLPAAAPQ
jgi:ribonuclease-3 family protein